MKYPFPTLFLICTGERCNAEARGEDRGEYIRDELKAHNKTLGRKPTVRVCAVSCLDLCDYGPNIVAQPSGIAYSHLNRVTARAVYDAETGDGPPRPDLEFEGR
jgi:(2Fe-2S) ferredoxin